MTKTLDRGLDKLINMNDEEYQVFLKKLEEALKQPVIVVNQKNF